MRRGCVALLLTTADVLADSGGVARLINNLRMDLETLASVAELLDGRGRQRTCSQRKSRRWRATTPQCVVQLESNNGVGDAYVGYVRNVSCTGMSFFMGSFVHRYGCTVTLMDRRKGRRQLRGHVVRCDHISRRLHEVGVQFDEPVDPAELIDLGDEPVINAENVLPSELTGRALVVTGHPCEYTLMQCALEESAVDLTRVDSAAAAMEAMRDDMDVIIVDESLPDMRGIDLIAKARTEGFMHSMILQSSDDIASIRAASLEAGANNVLCKPWQQQAFLQLLKEAMHAPGERSRFGPLLCDMDRVGMRAEQVIEYIEELDAFVNASLEAVESDDAERLMSTLKCIGGSAAGFGFEPIASSALDAVAALEAAGAIESCAKEIDRTVALCRRARVPAAALERMRTPGSA